jgi:FkbM family methyltransferase
MSILRYRQTGTSNDHAADKPGMTYTSTSTRGTRVGSFKPLLILILLAALFGGVKKFIYLGNYSYSTPNDPHLADHKIEFGSPHLLDCNTISMDDPSDNGMFVTTKTNPPFLMNIHNPKEDEVSNHVYDNGCWECSHIQGMLGALDKYSNSYFLDIGGNIGMWTLSAAAAKKQTFTIEPSPENFKRICKTVNKNAFHDRIHLMTIAATTKPETFRLNVPRGNKGGTSVTPVSEQDDLAKDDVNVIKGFRIDSLNLPTDRPVVMKVDVEGHELQALLGAMSFLQSANIVYAMMELRPNLHMDGGWKNIFDVLVSKGLEPSRLDNEGETKLDVNDLSQWKNQKHPKVRYYDVIWRMKED